jgi:hypothetical protein
MNKAYGEFGAVAVATVLSGWLGVAPVSTQQSSQGKAQGTAGTAAMVTPGDIARNPNRYFGQKVTVRAEIEDVLSRHVFLLDEDKLFAWPDVLVLTPALSSMIPEDEVVTVTGTVRAFVDADFRRDYNWKVGRHGLRHHRDVPRSAGDRRRFCENTVAPSWWHTNSRGGGLLIDD